MKTSVRFKSASETKKEGGEKVKTGNYRYWSVVGLIVEKLNEGVLSYGENALNEGKIRDIITKIKTWLKKIFRNIVNFLRKSVKNIIDFLQLEPEIDFKNNIDFT